MKVVEISICGSNTGIVIVVPLKKGNEIEKRKSTYTSRIVQNKKEEALQDIGVDRGAAHHGFLQGRGVQT